MLTADKELHRASGSQNRKSKKGRGGGGWGWGTGVSEEKKKRKGKNQKACFWTIVKQTLISKVLPTCLKKKKKKNLGACCRFSPSLLKFDHFSPETHFTSQTVPRKVKHSAAFDCLHNFPMKRAGKAGVNQVTEACLRWKQQCQWGSTHTFHGEGFKLQLVQTSDFFWGGGGGVGQVEAS